MRHTHTRNVKRKPETPGEEKHRPAIHANSRLDWQTVNGLPIKHAHTRTRACTYTRTTTTLWGYYSTCPPWGPRISPGRDVCVCVCVRACVHAGVSCDVKGRVRGSCQAHSFRGRLRSHGIMGNDSWGVVHVFVLLMVHILWTGIKWASQPVVFMRKALLWVSSSGRRSTKKYVGCPNGEVAAQSGSNKCPFTLLFSFSPSPSQWVGPFVRGLTPETPSFCEATKEEKWWGTENQEKMGFEPDCLQEGEKINVARKQRARSRLLFAYSTKTNTIKWIYVCKSSVMYSLVYLPTSRGGRHGVGEGWVCHWPVRPVSALVCSTRWLGHTRYKP